MGKIAKFAGLAMLITVACTAVAWAETRYTPEDIWETGYFWEKDWKAEFFEDWFGGQLNAMGEPSLWAVATDGTASRIYRFLELPTRTAATAARIVVEPDGSAKVHVVTLDGLGGYEPGNVAEHKLIELPPESVRQLHDLFQKNRFWTDNIGVSMRRDRTASLGCLDGVQYVLEAVSNGEYKLVTRDMCDVEDEIREILEAFGTILGREIRVIDDP